MRVELHEAVASHRDQPSIRHARSVDFTIVVHKHHIYGEAKLTNVAQCMDAAVEAFKARWKELHG